MGILRQLREFFDANNHPTADEYHADDPRAAAALQSRFNELVRRLRWAELERDYFKGELLKTGHTERSLAKRVELYARALRAAVKAS